MLSHSRIGVSNLDDAIGFDEGRLGLTLVERGEEHPHARLSGAGPKDPDGSILEISWA